ncbi:MAG: alpha/beta fold hydrolase [Candidatus Babeliales bacterium]
MIKRLMPVKKIKFLFFAFFFTTYAFLYVPQEPFPPYPYNVAEVKYKNKTAGISLSGTLTLPKTNKLHAAVLLIAGSGRQNRDEYVCGRHKILLVLADYLTRHGIAVLRFDKRGCGKSTGNYEMATTEDFASDVLAGVEYLKTRKDINPKQIGLIGHSEGGIIGPMVAAKSSNIAFVIMLAGPGVNGEEILYKQKGLILRANGKSEEMIELGYNFDKRLFEILKRETNLETAERQMHETIVQWLNTLSEDQKKDFTEIFNEKIRDLIVKRVNSGWFRFFINFEPSSVLKQVKVPILVLNGELDLQVSPKQNLPVIAQALKEAENNDYTILQLPKLNHLFQTCQTGSPEEYGKIEETFAPEALKIISDWILQRIN